MRPFTNLGIFLFTILCIGCASPPITISDLSFTSAGTHAAEELEHFFNQLYVDQEFSLANENDAAGIQLLLTEQAKTKGLRLDDVPTAKGGFAIFQQDGKGYIVAPDAEGLVNGVYALLEKAGVAFDFSGDILPNPVEWNDFQDWNFSDYPLAEERTVFNWHNFLSGCTGWDYEDWESWINQSQKMGYNTVMVHLYPNNPMFDFEFNGFKKEVGFITSSNKGRDWSTDHVNDVRRLPGGEIFDDAIFGSSVTKVQDGLRVSATQEMMGKVFAHADKLGMKVNMAYDFDLKFANPQEMVLSLPESDRFLIQNEGTDWMGPANPKAPIWLVNPETPEGRRFYKTQLEKFFALYPQIDRLILWKRTQRSPWTSIKREELPSKWKQEYDAIVKANPEVATWNESPASFAQGKLVRVFRDILNEMGKPGVGLGFGTWRWQSTKAMNFFYPDDVPLYPLDSEVVRSKRHLHNPELKAELMSYVKDKRLVPVIWPHHDDGAYLGSALPTYENFHSLLSDLKTNRFGMIHWMTKPFDMYFIHHNKQVWNTTKNQPLATTLAHLGEAWFGKENADVMTQYLTAYQKDMPSFGRETRTDFIDDIHYHYFESEVVEKVIKGIDERLALLNQVDAAAFTASQKERFQYFVDFEGFVKQFYQQENLFLRFKTAFEAGNEEEAKALANQFNPKETLVQYAKAIQNGTTTKGEKGVLFSMGLRWFPQFESAKQLVGLAPIKIKFAPTQHEELAQMPGRRTYFLSEEKELWKVLGEKELNQKLVKNSAVASEEEINAYGIDLSENATIPLQPYNTNHVLRGNYKIKLLIETKAEEGNLILNCVGKSHQVKLSEAGKAAFDFKFNGKKDPELSVSLEGGKATLSGLILERLP